MRIDLLDKVKKAMVLLDKTEDDLEATRCGLFLIQSMPLLVAELESTYKVVDAARATLQTIRLMQQEAPSEIFKNVVSGYFCLGEDRRLEESLKELDGEK